MATASATATATSPTNDFNRVLLEGYLKKHTGGIFFGTKRRWACLTSDGTLALAKRKEFPPYAFLKLKEYTEFSFDEDEDSISFCSVLDGMILKGVKFYVVDSPTIEEWTKTILDLRSTTVAKPPRRKSVLQLQRNLTLRDIYLRPDRKLGSQSNSDNALSELANIDPVLSVQAGGESVAKSGYIRKRGGGNGGSRAYKKRWFVLTSTGRVLYFKNNTSCASLGQFSLYNASVNPVGAVELNVHTDSRVWELQFDSEKDRGAWASALVEIIDKDDIPAESIIAPQGTGGIGDGGVKPLSHSLIHSPTITLGFPATTNTSSHDTSGAGSSVAHGMMGRRTSGRDKLKSESGRWDEVSVACVTWNMAESLPKMADIRFMKKLQTCQIVSVGVQECQSVMYRTFSSDQLSPVDVWLVMVKSVLGEGFSLVASQPMGAIHVCVFARHDIVAAISNVKTSFVPCGIGNVMYNKGAVGVSMKCYDTSVAFICAHLAANREKLLERNSDFHRIASNMIDALGRAAMEPAEGRFTTSEQESVDLDFYDVRAQERRSTIVESAANPMASRHTDSLEDLTTPNIRIKSGLKASALKEDDCSKRPSSSSKQQGPIDTSDRLSKEFDRCFFFGDLNYRLEAEKKWAQTLLSMSEKMLSLDLELRTGYAMPSDNLSESSQPSESGERNHKAIGRTSSADNREMDDIVESCNFSRPRGNSPPPTIPRPSEVEGMLRKLSTKVAELPNFSREEKTISIKEEDNEELQLLVNLVPIGDFGSDDDDEDEPETPKKVRSGSAAEEDEDVRMMQALEHGSEDDINEWRISGGVELLADVPNMDTVEAKSPAADAEVEETDVLTVHKKSAVKSSLFPSSSTSEEYHTVFGNLFRNPPKPLTASAKHALEFFKIQTGFGSPQDIYDRLMCFDQLLAEMAKGNVLQGFEEGHLLFKPSYKFDPFTETYDTGKKCRAPAWCDRILYNTPRYEKEIELRTYECIHGEFHSDHRAVVAIFKVKV